MEHGTILKVGVGISADAKDLSTHYCVNLRNTVDLDSVARSLSLPSIGLSALAYLYCGVRLEKRKKLIFSKWDGDLKEESIKYAALDAVFSKKVNIRH